MTANQRQPRENSHFPIAGWSDWEQAMVPALREGVDEPRGPGQVGFMHKNIRSAFPDLAQHCGIYEWRAKGTLHGQPNHVVYLGSTCRAKPGALRGRILKYCTNGSHKKDLINDALNKGYELCVRDKIVEGSKPRREDAEAMETHFSISMTMLEILESTVKHERFCHDVNSPIK